MTPQVASLIAYLVSSVVGAPVFPKPWNWGSCIGRLDVTQVRYH